MTQGPLAIDPLPTGLDAVWRVPGSKSITNRAVILAALAGGTSVLGNVLEADDTRHMRRCLTQLGVRSHVDDDQRLHIHGGLASLRASADPLQVGNSGTTVRFLAALCALIPGTHHLVGDHAMAKRPIQDLVDGLRQLGVPVECASGCPPLRITGGTLRGGRMHMRGDRSSQYFSALMMVAGLADSDLHIAIDGSLVSRPYVEMTARMVGAFGGSCTVNSTDIAVQRLANGGGYHARSYVIEPDASAASYAMALAAAGGHRLHIPDLNAHSLQGDYAFTSVLREMGALITSDASGTTVTGSGTLRGVDVDLHHCSDTVMTLAAIAPLAQGPTTIRNIANIRIKETDRLIATVSELRRLGQQVEHGEDWLRIEPRPLQPATIECYQDHRMAMAFAVLGSIAPGVTIADPACVAKTYPGFWHDLAALRPQAR